MREEIVNYLKGLRDSICSEFESIEASSEKFVRTEWDYNKGFGGGEMSVIRGKTFEKAAVNWSGVGGEHFPLDKNISPFFATGGELNHAYE